MEVGMVHQVDIDQQMQEAYLDYAMSVIVSRALPDVRDGLKPVHRRILYAMYDMGLRPNQPHRKSARIVGEVLGKYHPHGDATVYDAMVRMAQNFTMRAELVDGQGNFGSIDGDPAAAMRYTEARLTELADDMMADINKDTVDFTDNFDGSLSEPEVLPSRVPNFLVNGASGIAVGMATSIPPHNLGEVCDALTFMIERLQKDKDVTLDELLKFIKGPDFPTGGLFHRYEVGRKKGAEKNDLIRSAYAVGKSRVRVHAKVHIEEMSRNRNRLVITQLPYQTNKTNLIEKIANLARDGKLEGLVDLRDESDRQGMRIVIELSRTVKPKQILKRLFKITALKNTFSINMLALVDGEPRLLPLKRSLKLFVEHRQEIVTRRTQYELDQARYRLHILEGLRIALAHLDEIIDTIRRSRTTDTARKNLRKKFDLSEIQASAILDMPLRRLASLERKKIETEYKEVRQQVSDLEDLLNTPKKILEMIKEELIEIKAKYATPRRTIIIDDVAKESVMTARQLVPDESVVVCLSRRGQICHWPTKKRLNPARGRHKDPLDFATAARTRGKLYLFTKVGVTAMLPIHQLSSGKGPGEGLSLDELGLKIDHPVVAGITVSQEDYESERGYLFLVTQAGRVKRVTLADLWTIRKSEATVIGLDTEDQLVTAFLTTGEDDVILVTAQGQSIRFQETEVRTMGLPAAGVYGIKLNQGDYVVGAGPIKPRGDLITVTQKGWGKRTDLEEYPIQGRYGQGVKTMALDDKTGLIVAAATATASDRVMFIAEKGNNKTIYVRTVDKFERNHPGSKTMAVRGKNYLCKLIILETA